MIIVNGVKCMNSNLLNVTILSGVTKLNALCFVNCTNLNSAYFEGVAPNCNWLNFTFYHLRLSILGILSLRNCQFARR